MSQKEIREFISNSYKMSDVPTGTNFWKMELLQKAVNRLSEIVEIRGLPSSLPRFEIEKSLIMRGSCVVVKQSGMLWVPFGSQVWGGTASNVYSTSVQFNVANPILKSASGLDMIDGAIGYCTDIDKMGMTGKGHLWELIERYSDILAHIESTVQISVINKRMGNIAIATTSALASEYQNFYDNMTLGNTRAIKGTAFLDNDFKNLDLSDNFSLSELSELRDYYLNCFYNDLGLQTLEEKKERMVSDELNADSQILNNSMKDLIKNRVELVAKINLMYNANLECIVKEV